MFTIKQTLLTGWNLMRFLRLVFGLFFIIQAIQTQETFMGLAGGFFLLTALTNTGCCAAGRCATPLNKTNSTEPEEISYEEVGKNK